MTIREIYIRDASDPYYNPTIIDYNNESESIISQLRMILGTKNGEVLGNYDFGVDLNALVFGTKKDANSIIAEINQQIISYLYHSDNTTIECTIDFGDSGKGYDYAVLNVYVNGVKMIGFLMDQE